MQTVTESNNYSIVDITNPLNGTNTILYICDYKSYNVNTVLPSNYIIFKTNLNDKNSYILVLSLTITKDINSNISWYYITNTDPVVDPGCTIPSDMLLNTDNINIVWCQHDILNYYGIEIHLTPKDKDGQNISTQSIYVTGNLSVYGY